MLICPVCSRPLAPEEGALRCQAGHSFDLAANGYCNLMTGRKAGRFIGDDREMVLARRRFLESGAYEALRDVVCAAALDLTGACPRFRLLDAGCGEGYYTSAVTAAAEETGRLEEAVGLDISKSATRYAAGRDKHTRYVTASSYRMPIADGSADLILSLFAPSPAGEFQRILTPGGTVLQCVPGAEHLWELKQAVYDRPYPNREDKHRLEGFVQTDRRKLIYTWDLNSPEQIRDLFSMTPYVHRTPQESMTRLLALRHLTVTLSFLLLTWRLQE